MTVLLACMPAVAKTSKHSSHKHSHKASHRGSQKHGKRVRKTSWRSHGQQTIASDRVREIQMALIDQHYLTGDATGQMDTATRNALVKLQAENGWQTKVVPDARALIKLGLGPSRENLLNPETAAIAGDSLARGAVAER